MMDWKRTVLRVTWIAIPLATPLATAQISFSNVTASQGISFTHDFPAGDPMAMGAGGAFADFNQDGWLDFYLAQRTGANRLYVNLGAGLGFADVAAAYGVDDPSGEGTGAVFGDYDNDGDQDLYVLNRGNNIMFRNDGSDGLGGWLFTDVTATLGVQAFGRGSSAVFGDFDRDGWADLYVSNHSYALANPMPGDPWHSDYLFRNLGGQTFQDFTFTLPSALLSVAVAHSSGWIDYDSDGDLDLYVVNENMTALEPALTGENLMFRNDGSDGAGGWLWTEVGAAIGVNTKRHPMGLAIGDYNNDGRFDMLTSDAGANILYRNNGGTFTEVAAAAGIARPTVPGSGATQIGWGTVFLDCNLDGYEDAYVATGALASQTGQPNPSFLNNGNGTFTDVTATSGADDVTSGRGVARGDIDNDGDLDLLVINLDNAALLFRNDLSGGDYLRIKLVGTRSSRDAYGAIVKVSTAGWPDQYQMMQSGSSASSGHEKVLTFGVTGLTQVDTVQVDWPSGVQSTLNGVLVNQTLTIEEPKYFTNVTAAEGISFVHDHPSSDNMMRMGAGGAFGDYDGDGDLDLYLAQRTGASKLYQNQGPGLGFVDVAAAMGVDDPAGEGTGALFGDYDNDGDQDLYVMNRGNNIMFRNDGASFTDVTATLGVAGYGRTSAAAYGDFDNDGYLDLYVANHSFPTTPPAPGDLYRRDFLYRSVAGLYFEDYSASLNNALRDIGLAHSVGFVDFDNDGDLDIFVVNEDMSPHDPAITGEDLLYRNDGSDGAGGWLFTEIGATVGLTTQAHPMGLAIGDYNGDGFFDLATSDLGPNHLYQNVAGASFNSVAAAAGVQRTTVPGTASLQVGWGLTFLDWDLDGHEDLYVATGTLNGQMGQPNPLFTNNGNPPNNTFTEITSISGANNVTSGRCALKGDYDGDGDLDLVVVNLDNAALLFRNDQVGGDYLRVKLTGTTSNRDAIGAVVKVSTAGYTDQYQMVQSGSTTGGGHEKVLTFGVTDRTLVDVTIHWPSGQTTVLNGVAVNQQLDVEEPCLASWNNYGSGLAGTLGVPGVSLSANPVIGDTISLQLGNSSGAPAISMILFGISSAYTPAGWGGALLVQPSTALFLSVPAVGLSITNMVPTSTPICGLHAYLQMFQVDPGAPSGIANSPGLHMIIGN